MRPGIDDVNNNTGVYGVAAVGGALGTKVPVASAQPATSTTTGEEKDGNGREMENTLNNASK